MAQLSKAAFSGDPSQYSAAEWERACLVDKGDGEPKVRYSVPVREPDGTLNAGALAAAARQLSGTLEGLTEAQISKAQRRLEKAHLKAGLAVTLAKATVSGKARNDLPDSAFAYIEPGGTKDADGKTTPRSKRHFMIHDPAHVRDALARMGQGAKFSAEAKPKVMAAAKKFGIDVAKSDVQLERVVPVWKDDSKRIVYGVVLTPGLRDSQGDVVSAGDIEKAAHRWLTEYRKQDVQHNEVVTNDAGEPIARVVESFIAPADMDIAGQQVMKGSWVMATHVTDPATWEKVAKGQITGYSIGGSGERLADDDDGDDDDL